MNKPLIGLTPSWDDENNRILMNTAYADSILRAGGLPAIMPMTSDRTLLEQYCRALDGFLFTGGDDIDPSYYGEETLPCCGEIPKNRDEMELLLFNIAVLEMNKPAFGICRGIQVINVALGGSLYQDIPTQVQADIKLTHRQSPPYNVHAHSVSIVDGSPLHTLLGQEKIMVNSSHHQSIKKPAPELICMATAEDGVIEAVYSPARKFVYAVQWHPERTLHDGHSLQLFELFVQACM